VWGGAKGKAIEQGASLGKLFFWKSRFGERKGQDCPRNEENKEKKPLKQSEETARREKVLSQGEGGRGHDFGETRRPAWLTSKKKGTQRRWLSPDTTMRDRLLEEASRRITSHPSLPTPIRRKKVVRPEKEGIGRGGELKSNRDENHHRFLYSAHRRIVDLQGKPLKARTIFEKGSRGKIPQLEEKATGPLLKIYEGRGSNMDSGRKVPLIESSLPGRRPENCSFKRGHGSKGIAPGGGGGGRKRGGGIS